MLVCAGAASATFAAACTAFASFAASFSIFLRSGAMAMADVMSKETCIAM